MKIQVNTTIKNEVGGKQFDWDDEEMIGYHDAVKMAIGKCDYDTPECVVTFQNAKVIKDGTLRRQDGKVFPSEGMIINVNVISN